MEELRDALSEYITSRPQPPGKMSFEEFLAWCDEDTWAEWVVFCFNENLLASGEVYNNIHLLVLLDIPVITYLWQDRIVKCCHMLVNRRFNYDTHFIRVG